MATIPATVKLGDPLSVVWDDACTPDDHYWVIPADVAEIRSISTLGYYLKHTKRYLTIAQSSGNGTDPAELDGYGGAFSIPIGTIQSIKKL